MVSEFEYYSSKNIQMKLTPLKEILIGDSANIVMALIAGVVGTLFIAVANIANLFMARTAELQGSYSIHASLGASKSQLFKTILVESALLMFLALLVAFGIALSGFQLMSTHLLELLPRVNELSFNVFSLGITGLLFVIFAWLFAKLSLNIVDYQNINSQLQSGSKGGRKQVSKKKRRFIIVSQISIATLLVFINLNLFIDAWQVINDPLSIDIENSMRVEMSIDPTTSLSDDEKVQINKEIQAVLLTLPQVERVSIANGSVFNGGSRFRELKVKGNETNYPARSRIIDENYFSIYQQQLLAGDFFSNADIKDENKVLIINETFAHKIAPNGSAIGLIIDFNGESTYTVKGVVKSFKVPGEIENDNLLYFPGIKPDSFLVIQLKKHTSLSREAFVPFLKTVTSKYRVQAFESDIASQKKMLFIHFMILTATGSLALLTFFLAAIGLYGVLSYSTQLRQFEIGTRMAIGAKRSDLIKLIIKDNASAILLGVLLSVGVLSLLTIG
ncbi:FtsX-like permease family protein, partial [Colwellia sp. BRX10-4]|uniref:FtsX-like permease family protein n=1 Tax=Colwellia sp. BRX10-4 TaxID=2759843 RepID=UPI0015F51E2C